MPSFLRIGALLLAGLIISSHVAGHVARADAGSDKTIDRAQFIAITRIIQLPADEQEKSVPQLYQLLSEIPRERTLMISSIFYSRVPWRTPDHEKLSPEAQADLVEKQGQTQCFSLENEILARQTLQKYPAQTADLLRADLRSDDATRQRRGLSNFNELPGDGGLYAADGSLQNQANAIPFASFYEDIARIFTQAPAADPVSQFGINYIDPRTKPALKTLAENALMTLGDARAIALLIADDAAQPLLHYQAITALARRSPNDAALQSLAPFLKSDDATSRYRALYALPFSLSAVGAALPILIDDPDAQVRARAVAGAFQFQGPEFAALEAKLKSKLADDSPRVRWMAADGFASRKKPGRRTSFIGAFAKSNSRR